LLTSDSSCLILATVAYNSADQFCTVISSCHVTFKYLGFLWSLARKTVQIPEAKKTRYLSKLELWTTGQKFSRKDAESVLGTLVHCSLAVPDGRFRLPALSRFTASFNFLSSPFVRRSPNPSVLSDISWWRTALSRYSGAIKQFIRFCDSEQVPAHMCFPANELLLCAFAASSLGKHARSTPRSHLSALRAWHVAHNMEWKGSSRLRYVLNGVHNQAPGTSSRPPRPPINARMLIQLIRALDLAVPLDAAVAACAATAFWGQCRLGELLPLSPLLPLPVPLSGDAL
jgi:hypothetical protein